MIKFLIFASFIFFTTWINAELPCKSSNDSKSNLKIYGPPFMDLILKKNKNLTIKGKELSGLRIQIYASTDKNAVNRVKNGIELKYPDLEVYLLFESPEYKLRVGDYRNRMEASPDLFMFRPEFPNASLVPSKIKFPKLN